MLAALKFFLGQDQVPEGEEDESSDDEEEGDIKALGPTKAEFYKANKKVWTASCLQTSFCPDGFDAPCCDENAFQEQARWVSRALNLYSDPISAWCRHPSS